MGRGLRVRHQHLAGIRAGSGHNRTRHDRLDDCVPRVEEALFENSTNRFFDSGEVLKNSKAKPRPDSPSRITILTGLISIVATTRHNVHRLRKTGAACKCVRPMRVGRKRAGQ
jgi:hypothetical protein